ncbi:MAG: hypothetical protein JWR19_238 [Pedosphaera sp.]|nr:hypothetical protein [Pedosphaera sp.]
MEESFNHGFTRMDTDRGISSTADAERGNGILTAKYAEYAKGAQRERLKRTSCNSVPSAVRSVLVAPSGVKCIAS